MGEETRGEKTKKTGGKKHYGVRKVYHGVRTVYHGVRKVYHGVRKVFHGIGQSCCQLPNFGRSLEFRRFQKIAQKMAQNFCAILKPTLWPSS